MRKSLFCIFICLLVWYFVCYAVTCQKVSRYSLQTLYICVSLDVTVHVFVLEHKSCLFIHLVCSFSSIVLHVVFLSVSVFFSTSVLSDLYL